MNLCHAIILINSETFRIFTIQSSKKWAFLRRMNGTKLVLISWDFDDHLFDEVSPEMSMTMIILFIFETIIHR